MDGSDARLTADRTAVLDVIRAETEAFIDGDFDAWCRFWVRDGRTHDVYMSQDFGLVFLKGWEAVAGHMQETLEDRRRPPSQGPAGGYAFTQSDHDVTIHGDMAWVTFRASCDIGEHAIAPESFETRILERRDGAWKIVYAAYAALRSGHDDRPLVEVDGSGLVLWASERTRAALACHAGLTISAGRLRATRPAWDKPLQAAIAKAATRHGIFAQSAFSNRSGSRFAYPVVLGEDEGGAVLACMVRVQNGTTCISFDDERVLEDRLQAATVVFGLSAGQRRLAGEILQGKSLTDAAGNLRISINTARTHLGRIYDKTGVNSQTALVRVLLSVG